MAGLLTALLYGAGGYGQGRQQALQNKQTNEQIANEQAYRQAEEKRQDEELTLEQQKAKRDQDAYTRSTGTDPATGKPFVNPPALNRIVPGKVGTNYTPTLQDLYNHQMLWYSTLQGRGQPDQAAGWLSQAQETARQMNAAQTQAAEDKRDKYNQFHEDMRDQYNQTHEDSRSRERESFDMWLHDQPTAYQKWEEQHGGGAKGANKASTDEATWYTKWSKLTTAQDSQVPGVKNPPVIPPAQAAAASKKFSYIDHAPNPREVAAALAAKEPNALIKAFILERGNVAAEKKAGASSGDTGVSDDAENPTKGEKIPAHDIWQMVYESGATPEEATTLTSIAMAESGGDPTSVNRTDNHGKQTSWGLFQVSDGTHHEPQGWQDPETNIQMALAKLRSQGLQAWGTYNSGAYRKFMPASEQGE